MVSTVCSRSRSGRMVRVSVLALLVTACATPNRANIPPSVAANLSHAVRAQTFAEYRASTVSHLRTQRTFQSVDVAAEVEWNAPGEWTPAEAAEPGQPRKGILLIHGLGDSPWTFVDIAAELSKRGYLVRTILLPGHGTRPEDVMYVTADDWRQVVRQQADAMRRDVDTLYLGGFSTGANLALEYAYDHADVAGLVLFSPGFKSLSLDWLAPALAGIRPWLIRPGPEQSLQTSVRYLMVPTNGFAQFYYTSRNARRLLAARPYDKPVFMAVAQHDSVLNTGYLLETFERRFTHPGSRLIWYGSLPQRSAQTRSSRVIARPDRLPEWRISQFSHMALPFAPSNPLYGAHGASPLCFNGQGGDRTRACEAGAPVWYSDWGHHEKGKVHARLTFNPYFTWQAGVIAAVLDGEVPASEPAAFQNTIGSETGGKPDETQ